MQHTCMHTPSGDAPARVAAFDWFKSRVSDDTLTRVLEPAGCLLRLLSSAWQCQSMQASIKLSSATARVSGCLATAHMSQQKQAPAEALPMVVAGQLFSSPVATVPCARFIALHAALELGHYKRVMVGSCQPAWCTCTQPSCTVPMPLHRSAAPAGRCCLMVSCERVPLHLC
jgi:hypothetical protein